MSDTPANKMTESAPQPILRPPNRIGFTEGVGYRKKDTGSDEHNGPWTLRHLFQGRGQHKVQSSARPSSVTALPKPTCARKAALWISRISFFYPPGPFDALPSLAGFGGP